MNHSLSRGSAQPEIDARYYEHDADLTLHIEAAKYTLRNAQTLLMRDPLEREHSPGREVQTDEQLRDWVKLTMSAACNTAVSCSMFPRATNGVVDPTLKVYGTQSLRVADLSLVPLHFASHTQATVYAIA